MIVGALIFFAGLAVGYLVGFALGRSRGMYDQ